MTNQKVPVFLILMMLIMPIASAFGHCSGMDMSVDLSAGNNSLTVENLSSLGHKIMLEQQQENQVELNCYSGSSCVYHACTIYGFAAFPAAAFSADIATHYSSFEDISFYKTALPPHLRPPIFSL